MFFYWHFLRKKLYKLRDYNNGGKGFRVNYIDLDSEVLEKKMLVVITTLLSNSVFQLFSNYVIYNVRASYHLNFLSKRVPILSY